MKELFREAARRMAIKAACMNHAGLDTKFHHEFMGMCQILDTLGIEYNIEYGPACEFESVTVMGEKATVGQQGSC